MGSMREHLKRQAMMKTSSLALFVLLVSSAVLVTINLPIVSADDGHNSVCNVPTTKYPHIQDAINDTSCTKIRVAAGTYHEQLAIKRPLTLQGGGGAKEGEDAKQVDEGDEDAENPTIIKPMTVTANACRHGGLVIVPFCAASNPSEAAIILVSGTTVVTLDNLVVDGSLAASSITSCAPPKYIGILFSGASGAIRNSKVTNLFQASPSLYGCQDSAGLGIYVQTPSGVSVVSINHNTVTNYQKNGITCNDSGSTCSINDDTVSPLAGATSTTGDATNGIQVGFGAVGTVKHNEVSGNECNVPAMVCGPDLVTETQAAGILLFQAGVGTSVRDNKVSSSDIGIAVVGPNGPGSVTLKSNKLTNNRYAGMLVQDGTYTVSDTEITGTGNVAMGVLAFTTDTSVTLKNVESDLPFFTFATPLHTAFIFLKK